MSDHVKVVVSSIKKYKTSSYFSLSLILLSPTLIFSILKPSFLTLRESPSYATISLRKEKKTKKDNI